MTKQYRQSLDDLPATQTSPAVTAPKPSPALTQQPAAAQTQTAAISAQAVAIESPLVAIEAQAVTVEADMVAVEGQTVEIQAQVTGAADAADQANENSKAAAAQNTTTNILQWLADKHFFAFSSCQILPAML